MLAKLFRRDSEPAVEKGCLYRRVRADRMVETAKVIDIHRDSLGIPHVRYHVMLGRIDGVAQQDGPRMLSLASFMQQYRERVIRATTAA
jgi:hypothetical protein